MQKNIIVLILVAWCASLGHATDDDDNSVVYDKDTLDADVAEKNLFVMFFAPWCGHCKMLKPTWNDLAKQYNVEGSQITIGKVDCTQHREACSKNGVTGYPTLKFFSPGKDAVKYAQMRTLDGFKSFIETQLGEKSEEPEVDDEEVAPAEANNGLYDLSDANFASHIKKGHHFVKFYAPWCGHCKRLAPVWEAVAATYKDNDKVTIAKVDCTKSSKACSSQGIRGYPTLIWFTDGVKSNDYNKARTEDAITGFIESIVGVKAEEARTVTEGKIPEVKEDGDDLNVVVLTDYDFQDTVSDDFTFVMFYNQACKECTKIREDLELLGTKYVDKTEYLFAVVNCDAQKDTCKSEKASGSFPLFKLYHNGKDVDTYSGDATVAAIAVYMEKKENELQPKIPHGGEL